LILSRRGARTSRASGRAAAGAGVGATDPPASATTGLETKLWASADMLRNNMDAAEYKHIVLGLIFLKYISDAFEAKHAELAAAAARAEGADPEDPDEYKAASIFWVPREARWSQLINLVSDIGLQLPRRRLGSGQTDEAIGLRPEGTAGCRWTACLRAIVNFPRTHGTQAPGR
jgi:hypothetical protein